MSVADAKRLRCWMELVISLHRRQLCRRGVVHLLLCCLAQQMKQSHLQPRTSILILQRQQ